MSFVWGLVVGGLSVFAGIFLSWALDRLRRRRVVKVDPVKTKEEKVKRVGVAPVSFFEFNQNNGETAEEEVLFSISTKDNSTSSAAPEHDERKGGG
ncbi:hypothetical protein LCGC14_0484710 [marine sediment metagenome]|uniref:Uncharacterized protein n=1 Tax=marine sediment metagenome TaxID=412755 RepID=A0A0F9VGZ3_9ZZZZ